MLKYLSVGGGKVRVPRVKPRDEWIVVMGKREPLVEPAVFERVLGIIKGKAGSTSPRRSPEAYPSLGKLRCMKCGGRMYGSTRRKGGKVYRYYKCAAAQEKGPAACPGTTVRVEEAEARMGAREVRSLPASGDWGLSPTPPRKPRIRRRT
jgi:hypothetical protein